MGSIFVIPEEYRRPESIEVGIKLLEYYIKNKNHDKGLISYGRLCDMLSFDVHPRVVDIYLGDVSYACKENGLPPISAIVVSGNDSTPGDGFYKAYCPGKKGDERIVEWVKILDEIHAYENWNQVLEAYRMIG